MQLIFYIEFRNLDKVDDYMQCKKNKIKVEWIWFCGVSKYMNRFIVRLKAIKYKEDFFYYLFFYSDLDF